MTNENEQPDENEIADIQYYFRKLSEIADKYDLCVADLTDYE